MKHLGRISIRHLGDFVQRRQRAPRAAATAREHGGGLAPDRGARHVLERRRDALELAPQAGQGAWPAASRRLRHAPGDPSLQLAPPHIDRRGDVDLEPGLAPRLERRGQHLLVADLG